VILYCVLCVVFCVVCCVLCVVCCVLCVVLDCMNGECRDLNYKVTSPASKPKG
jgi:hypothetical protein